MHIHDNRVFLSYLFPVDVDNNRAMENHLAKHCIRPYESPTSQKKKTRIIHVLLTTKQLSSNNKQHFSINPLELLSVFQKKACVIITARGQLHNTRKKPNLHTWLSDLQSMRLIPIIIGRFIDRFFAITSMFCRATIIYWSNEGI